MLIGKVKAGQIKAIYRGVDGLLGLIKVREPVEPFVRDRYNCVAPGGGSVLPLTAEKTVLLPEPSKPINATFIFLAPCSQPIVYNIWLILANRKG